MEFRIFRKSEAKKASYRFQPFGYDYAVSETRVIIYINFVDLESPTVHAKRQDNQTSGSCGHFSHVT